MNVDDSTGVMWASVRPSVNHDYVSAIPHRLASSSHQYASGNSRRRFEAAAAAESDVSTVEESNQDDDDDDNADNRDGNDFPPPQRTDSRPNRINSGESNNSARGSGGSGVSGSSGGSRNWAASPLRNSDDPQPVWTRNLDQLVAMFQEKCSKRIVLHREAAHYYSRRMRWLSVPSALFGTLASITNFSTWSQDFNAMDLRFLHYIILGAGICGLISTVLSALLADSKYPAKYASSLKSYRNFDSLLKNLTVERSFEPSWRQPVREFVRKMVDDYARYTDEAELPPHPVEKRVQKAFEEASRNAAFSAASSAVARSSGGSFQRDLEGGDTPLLALSSSSRSTSLVDENRDSDDAAEKSGGAERTRFRFRDWIPIAAGSKSIQVQPTERQMEEGLAAVTAHHPNYHQQQHQPPVTPQASVVSTAATTARFCGAMPYSAMIEMQSPTFVELQSASESLQQQQHQQHQQYLQHQQSALWLDNGSPPKRKAPSPPGGPMIVPPLSSQKKQQQQHHQHHQQQKRRNKNSSPNGKHSSGGIEQRGASIRSVASGSAAAVPSSSAGITDSQKASSQPASQPASQQGSTTTSAAKATPTSTTTNKNNAGQIDTNNRDSNDADDETTETIIARTTQVFVERYVERTATPDGPPIAVRRESETPSSSPPSASPSKQQHQSKTSERPTIVSVEEISNSDTIVNDRSIV